MINTTLDNCASDIEYTHYTITIDKIYKLRIIVMRSITFMLVSSMPLVECSLVDFLTAVVVIRATQIL